MKKEIELQKILQTYKDDFSNKIILVLLALLSPFLLNSQSIDSYTLPDCSSIQAINFNVAETLLEENRYQYYLSKDTLNAIYCYSESNNHTELKANVLAKLASYTIDQENDDKVFERFLSLLNLSIEISEKNNFVTPLIHAYELLCSNFTANRLYDLANLYANKFIKIANVSGDSMLIAEGYMHLGRILREEGKFSASDSILHLSLTYLANDEVSNRTGAWCYLHLSNLKRLEEKYEASIEFAKKGILLLQHNKDINDIQIGMLALELILSNIQLGNYNNEEWHKKITDSKNLTKWMKGQQLFVYGQEFEKQGLIDQAINSYLEALTVSKNAANYQSAVTISKSLLPLIEQKDVSSRAIETFNVLQEAIDNLNHQNGSNNLLESAFFKIENQKNKNVLLQNDLAYSQKVVSYTIGLIILFLAIIALIFKQNREVKKLNDSIKKLNVGLTEKNKELEHSYEEIENRKYELIVEMKEHLLFLSNQENMIGNLKKFVNKAGDLTRKTKMELLNITNTNQSNEIIRDIDIKFLELNDSLLSKLSFNFPNLTSNDLKLCMYLSMNMSTKEIAQVQCKSIDSIKVARSRLRKKLNINASSEKLSTFLNGYKMEDASKMEVLN